MPLCDGCLCLTFTDEETEACRGPGYHTANGGTKDVGQGLSVCLLSL